MDGVAGAGPWPTRHWCRVPVMQPGPEAAALPLVTRIGNRRGVDPAGETAIPLVPLSARAGRHPVPAQGSRPHDPTQATGPAPAPAAAAAPSGRRPSPSSARPPPASTSTPTCTWSASRPERPAGRPTAGPPRPPVRRRHRRPRPPSPTWLKACGVTTVAMESTGVYWIPLFELLEARGASRSSWSSPGQLSPVRGAAQDRHARLPVDPAAALLRPAAAVVPAPRRGPGPARLLPAAADAGPLRRQPHPAHAEGPGADERQADRGRQRHHRA